MTHNDNQLILQEQIQRLLRSIPPTVKPMFAVAKALAKAFQANFSLDLNPYHPHAEEYRRLPLLSVEARQPFSLTLIILAPWQETPVHSHCVDCAPICLKGRIEETIYDKSLKPLSRKVMKPYQTSCLHHHLPNTHQLKNLSPQTSISLHLYSEIGQTNPRYETDKLENSLRS